TVDLNLDKSFALAGKMEATVYMRVTNLFNTRNVLNVYDRSGNADDDGFLSNTTLSEDFIEANGGQRYVDLYQALNLNNGQSYWDRLNLQLWDHPRQIFLGFRLNY
ncbi:MAG: hypothetical protein KDI06_22790, partial [Calditrichaeota bacterium]|nr:hypothetical protein [Calditrichota bacterium]